MRKGIERTVEGGNELGSESAECEGLVDALGKGASGISVAAGGLVENLIFGCVQPSQRYSITDTRTGDIRVLVVTTWGEDSGGRLLGPAVLGLLRLEGRGPYFDSLGN
jgi:hypothetical protein